ncbi:unnamed protein product, partial [Amoebophrya sp. A120]
EDVHQRLDSDDFKSTWPSKGDSASAKGKMHPGVLSNKSAIAGAEDDLQLQKHAPVPLSPDDLQRMQQDQLTT